MWGGRDGGETGLVANDESRWRWWPGKEVHGARPRGDGKWMGQSVSGGKCVGFDRDWVEGGHVTCIAKRRAIGALERTIG